MNKKIILIGMSGVGKSTVGKLLASILNIKFIDLDEVIVNKSAMSISTIFAIHGENYFRTYETNELMHSLSFDNYVLATGGGVVLSIHNRILMQNSNAIIIYLSASLKYILYRLQLHIADRPLLMKDGISDILELMSKKRIPLYQSLAHFIVNTNHLTIEQITINIKKYINKFA